MATFTANELHRAKSEAAQRALIAAYVQGAHFIAFNDEETETDHETVANSLTVLAVASCFDRATDEVATHVLNLRRGMHPQRLATTLIAKTHSARRRGL